MSNPSRSRSESITEHTPDHTLPVIDVDPRTGRKRSRAGLWRAWSLVGVHLLMIGHYLHWVWAGKTLTPVEPSEAMDTLRAGEINMGFLFFAAALLATLVLGRWVCGWGCHLIAYQDLTLWVFKRLRLRPKAFRTRFMVFIPLAAAIYMFLWPLGWRIWHSLSGGRPPAFAWHLSRVGFWDTFPGVLFAIITVLSCGVAIIYFLGPKGFCTYACPYGGFFALTDRLAPARIRVTDACRECGHCTAACTSNVRVAEEVKLYKMVVDPGCMKCLDCVQTCPNDALYFGFGRPALGVRPLDLKKPRRYDLSLAEELVAIVLFSGVFFSIWGLYNVFPFLMSLGIAGIVTFLLMKGIRVFHARDVLIQRIRLKIAGRIRPLGIGYLLLTCVMVALIAHSGVWSYHDYLAERAFTGAPGETPDWPYNPRFAESATDEQKQQVRAGIAHLELCESWGFLGDVQNNLNLAWLYLFTDDRSRAADQLRKAISLYPQQADLYRKLAQVETFLSDEDGARTAYAQALTLDKDVRIKLIRKTGPMPHPRSALLWVEWGRFLFHQGHTQDAAEAYRQAIDFDPDNTQPRIALADFQVATRDVDAARRTLLDAMTINPHVPEIINRLDGLRMLERQDFALAVEDYRPMIDRHPNHVVLRHNLAHALTRLNRYVEAVEQHRKALELDPDALQVRFDLGAVLLLQRDLAGVFREYERIVATPPVNDQARLLVAETGIRLGGLYAETGQREKAIRALGITLKHGNTSQCEYARKLMDRL